MLPHFVLTLEQYWTWLDERINHSPGHLEGNILSVSPLLDAADQLVGLMVLNERIYFADGSFLQASFTVNAQLETEDHKFHYQAADGSLIWRKDLHEGNPAGHAHIHLKTGEHEASPYHPVDLDEALDEVLDFLNGGGLPDSD